MSTSEKGQISPYCHFYKIIKEPGTSWRASWRARELISNIEPKTC